MFFFRKALWLLFSLWCVVTITFFLMHAIPGDPFIGEQPIPPEVLESLYRYYGLNEPLWKQYGKYLSRLLHGDLGVSIVYPGQSVTRFIREGFPLSFRLGLQALCIAIPFGIFLGSWAALKRGKWQDTLAMVVSTLGVSVPNFVLSCSLQWLFALKLSLLPVARWGEGFSHSILPTIALAALPTAFIARLTRSNLVEVLEQDYIRTAHAKGLHPFRIILIHGLKNALLPVLTYLGPVTAQILTGSFMVEKIFALPGLGQWMIMSIHSRDYPMILGLALFFSTWLMILMFVIDQLYAFLDPRMRIQRKVVHA